MKQLLLAACYTLINFCAFAQEQSFDSWLQDLRTEASSLGISETTLVALDQLEAPLDRILELDSSQPEFVQTFTRYLSLRITPTQIDRGRALLSSWFGWQPILSAQDIWRWYHMLLVSSCLRLDWPIGQRTIASRLYCIGLSRRGMGHLDDLDDEGEWLGGYPRTRTLLALFGVLT